MLLLPVPPYHELRPMTAVHHQDAVSHTLGQSVLHAIASREEAELRKLCKTSVGIYHEVFEVVTNGDLILTLS